MIDSPLKWHGGKSYLRRKFLAMMPEHTRYTEAFFGGGWTLLAKDPGNCAEFVNDLNGELTNFWRVLQNAETFERFRQAVEACPFSSVEFRAAGEVGSPFPWTVDEEIDRAVAFFIRNRQSRQGLMRDFATPTRRTRRGMNENVSAWLTAVDGLPAVHARLRRVEIDCRPALEFLQRFDSPDALHYLDPPYLHSTRVVKSAYAHEMTADDHAELLWSLDRLQGRWMISGYRSDLYDEWAEDRGYQRVDFAIDKKSSSAAVKPSAVECVWCNFPITKG